MSSSYDFHDKKFRLVDNSINGEVSDQTIFHYKQERELVTADYSGGSVVYGKIIAILNGSQLNMVYQCLLKTRELKSGKAVATIQYDDQKKINLFLEWQWLDEKAEKGTSHYIEI